MYAGVIKWCSFWKPRIDKIITTSTVSTIQTKGSHQLKQKNKQEISN